MEHKILQSVRRGLFLLTAALILLPSAGFACGYGTSGGADFVPQRQDAFGPAGPTNAATAVTAAQARDIVSRQILKLNPNLRVASVSDAGRYYEVRVVNKKNEIVQVLGVDKTTALLTLLN